MDIYAQIRKNNRNTWVLLSIFIALFLCIGLGFDHFQGAGMGSPYFTFIALGFGLASSVSGYWFGDKMVLSSTHARPLDRNDAKEAQWQNVVEEMSIAAGIPVPATYVIDDTDANAFATGRDPKHASIAVTKGLLASLNREELQAVAAHEMSHVKNLDIRLMLMVAVLVGSLALLADWARRSLFHGRNRGKSSDKNGAGALIALSIWLAAVILAPIFSQLIALSVSRKREYLADASGAELTRNPSALAAALAKIASHTAPTASIHRGTAHLCIEDPRGNLQGESESFVANLFATHPPINKRIEALKQMAYLK